VLPEPAGDGAMQVSIPVTSSLPGPVVLTWLMLRASRLRQENDIGNRRPQYADYVLKTNAFFPARRRN